MAKFARTLRNIHSLRFEREGLSPDVAAGVIMPIDHIPASVLADFVERGMYEVLADDYIPMPGEVAPQWRETYETTLPPKSKAAKVQEIQ